MFCHIRYDIITYQWTYLFVLNYSIYECTFDGYYDKFAECCTFLTVFAIIFKTLVYLKMLTELKYLQTTYYFNKINPILKFWSITTPLKVFQVFSEEKKFTYCYTVSSLYSESKALGAHSNTYTSIRSFKVYSRIKKYQNLLSFIIFSIRIIFFRIFSLTIKKLYKTKMYIEVQKCLENLTGLLWNYEGHFFIIYSVSIMCFRQKLCILKR